VLIKYSLVKKNSDFDQMSLVFESLLAVRVPYGAAHHHWEKDQHDDFALLYDIDL